METLKKKYVIVHTSLYTISDQGSMLTLSLPDQICNSPYCLPYNSYNISSESLVLDQRNIPKLIFLFILITHLLILY